MKKLLSLPTNLVRYFNAIEDKDPKTWFCASDPPGNRIGSGGGTFWILKENWKNENGNFLRWLAKNAVSTGRIKTILNKNPPNKLTRFVYIDLLLNKFQVNQVII